MKASEKVVWLIDNLELEQIKPSSLVLSLHLMAETVGNDYDWPTQGRLPIEKLAILKTMIDFYPLRQRTSNHQFEAACHQVCLWLTNQTEMEEVNSKQIGWWQVVVACIYLPLNALWHRLPVIFKFLFQLFLVLFMVWLFMILFRMLGALYGRWPLGWKEIFNPFYSLG